MAMDRISISSRDDRSPPGVGAHGVSTKSQDRSLLLVEFAYKHLDFQIAELESVLDMMGYRLEFQQTSRARQAKGLKMPGAIILCLPLPNETAVNSTCSSNASCSIGAAAVTSPRRPFVLLSMPTDDRDGSTAMPPRTTPELDISSKQEQLATFLVQRCTLVRSVLELWGYAATDPSSAVSLPNAVHPQDAQPNVIRRESDPQSQEAGRITNGWDDGLQACVHDALNWVHGTASGQAVWNAYTKIDPQSAPSWKLTVHTMGTKMSREDHETMRCQFTPLLQHMAGPVRMKDPDQEFVLIREVSLNTKGGPILDSNDSSDHDTRTLSTTNKHDRKANSEPDDLQQVAATTTVSNKHRSPPHALAWYFGRALGGLRKVKQSVGAFTSCLPAEYRLNNRPYLGPTSMDAELCFIMTNLGQVHTGCTVLDPFCGTGSILLVAALRGAYCVGTDIDWRVLRGKGPQQTIMANFAQFRLPRPELIRSDNALYDRHFRTHEAIYHAILCDPPYGIRAGARQSGARQRRQKKANQRRRHNITSATSQEGIEKRENAKIGEERDDSVHDGDQGDGNHDDDDDCDDDEYSVKSIPDHYRDDHIAQTRPYPVNDVMCDLLDVAARTLVMFGRLVYLIPSFAHDFDVRVDLPRHECLELIHVCYQPLSTTDLGRRMVVMQKVQPYDPTQRSRYLKSSWSNGAASAEKCANIRDKILEQAKNKPGYEQRLAMRKQKRQQHRQERKRTKLELRDLERIE